MRAKCQDCVMEPIVIDDLAAFQPRPGTGLVTRALADGPGMKVTLFALCEGHRMAEHRTPHAASVFVTRGEVSFSVNEEWHRLAAGGFVFLPPGCAHAVRAETDCQFALVAARPV